MKKTQEEFTLRQFMVERYYEYHHYINISPPDIDFHQHPFYEIFVFLSGNASYVIEGRTYKLRPGDILLTSNEDIHRPEVYTGKPYERFVIWLSSDFFDYIKDFGDDLSACFTDASSKDYRLIRPSEHRFTKMKRLIDQLDRLREDSNMGSKALTHARIIEFLVQISRAYYDTADMVVSISEDISEDNRINQIVTYINEHLSEELSLDQIADAFYLSKFYLSKRFKQYTGLSIYQYIMKKRLTVARNMLSEGVPVIEACNQCGFGDYSNFLKAFKREFTCTPTSYMKQMQ